jgi:3-hydroxyisobutyrate dehydrogenase-like beta-hydroxyacid dehydrogenase
MPQAGSAANMKLAVNMMMATHLAAAAEGIALARAAGLDVRALTEIVGLSAIATPLLAAKASSSSARLVCMRKSSACEQMACGL